MQGIIHDKEFQSELLQVSKQNQTVRGIIVEEIHAGNHPRQGIPERIVTIKCIYII